jgi:trypsin
VYPEQRKSKEKQYNYTPSMKLLTSLSVLLSLVSSIVHADNDLHLRPMNQLLQEVQEVDAENEEAARSSSKTTNSVRGMEDVSKIDFTPKIVNGVVVNPAFKYPYMVNGGRCGASLVAPNCLLSAAHCEGVIKQVQIGRHDLTDLTEKFETFDVVEEFTLPHPKYDEAKPPKYDYDYMMLKLNGTSSRTPVQLDTGADTSFLEAGNNVTVMGWGHTSYGGPSSNVLLEVEIDVISTAKCQESYLPTITDRMFCAARANKNMCQGDSGGPIIDEATGKQIGVSSFTPDGKCADSNYPHGYAKVRDQIGWIENFIKDHCIAPTSPSSSPSSSPTPAPPTPPTPTKPAVSSTNEPTATPTLTVAPTCPPTKAECGGGKC